MEKECRECQSLKPLSGYYLHKGMSDGHLNKCKECCKRLARQNREHNAEYYADYDRQRSKTDRRKAQKNKSVKKWRRNNPEGARAHSAVGNAKRRGEITEAPCAVCGSDKVEAHHDDYSRPLDVLWLCHKHHMEHHGRNQY